MTEPASRTAEQAAYVAAAAEQISRAVAVLRARGTAEATATAALLAASGGVIEGLAGQVPLGLFPQRAVRLAAVVLDEAPAGGAR